MKIEYSEFPEVIKISPKIFFDNRGYFFESYNFHELEKLKSINSNFVIDGESKSKKGVIRGIHYQSNPFAQNKLVRVIHGEVLDIVVDLRKNSNNFGRYFATKLSDNNKCQLFIPKGFGHGFLTLTDEAVMSYKVDNIYSPDHYHTILWNDKDLNIDWPIDKKKVILSDNDSNGVDFKDAVYF